MKRSAIYLLVLCLLLSGCTPQKQPELNRYTATFLDLFDTVTTIVGHAETKEEFEAQARSIHDNLEYYHHLFDIYNEYPGVNNLKVINDQAGISPVQVDEAIIQLLKDCKSFYELTGGRVNVAMGSVLQLWHTARNDGLNDPANAYLPDSQALKLAAEHTDPEAITIDEAASTIFISDPMVQLDVGAVAKGWATQKVAETAPEGMLISVGGNVCATGVKQTDASPWVIGIQDPDDANGNLHTLYVSKTSVVTSGDYQRCYWVDGKPYHHIIDPDTCMPGSYWRCVSIVCVDSALADALSTALFLLPLEEGKALAESCDAEAFWVSLTGEEYMTSGFENIMRT